jgi:hypothetical protein
MQSRIYFIFGLVLAIMALSVGAMVVWGLAVGQLVALGGIGVLVALFFLMNARMPSDPTTHEESRAALQEALRGERGEGKKPGE